MSDTKRRDDITMVELTWECTSMLHLLDRQTIGLDQIALWTIGGSIQQSCDPSSDPSPPLPLWFTITSNRRVLPPDFPFTHFNNRFGQSEDLFMYPLFSLQ